MDSDEALFDRWVGGDLGAFDQLYARYERPLFGFIRAFVRHQTDAEDVLHDTFMAVLRERDRRGQVRSFRAWAYQVARNLCLNRARSRSRGGRAVERAATLVEPVPTADVAMERVELARALNSAVDKLPQPLAEVYRLRAAGVSYDEASAILAIPVGTVKSRAHEMVKRLRKEIDR